MQDTWLIQRLNPPAGEGPLAALGEAFSFGGGRRNGGLSDEAISMLRPVFSFDYMGAAEFELGAVPEALQRLAKAKDIAAVERTIVMDGTPHPIYLIASARDIDEVAERVQSWVLPHGERPRFKEVPMLDCVLAGEDWARSRGWLELDNGFFAFTDRTMWAGTAAVFGVEVSEAVSS